MNCNEILTEVSGKINANVSIILITKINSQLKLKIIISNLIGMPVAYCQICNIVLSLRVSNALKV